MTINYIHVLWLQSNHTVYAGAVCTKRSRQYLRIFLRSLCMYLTLQNIPNLAYGYQYTSYQGCSGESLLFIDPIFCPCLFCYVFELINLHQRTTEVISDCFLQDVVYFNIDNKYTSYVVQYYIIVYNALHTMAQNAACSATRYKNNQRGTQLSGRAFVPCMGGLCSILGLVKPKISN